MAQMKKKSGRKVLKEERRKQLHGSHIAFISTVVAVVAVFAVVIGVSTIPLKDPARSGESAVFGVEADVKTIALGHVPLDKTVEPSWRLTNTTSWPVVLGEPHAEAVDGCCPGPLQLGKTMLLPGESTSLVFPLQMHAGMDGTHDFTIHVPVEAQGQNGVMELRTTGHFSP